MKLKDFKEWLNQFPEETEVWVLKEYQGSWTTTASFTRLELTPYETWEFVGGKDPTLFLGDK